MFERRKVDSNTATEVVVESPFSFLPSEATSPNVEYQDPDATCHEGPGANVDGYLCLMQEFSNADAFDENGAPLPYEGVEPSTDFCSAGNHDPDGDSAQHAELHKSCWEVIADTMATRFDYPLTVPDPPSLLAEANWSPALEPEFISLAEEVRLALVVDRSGSMSEDDRIANARSAARYWVDRLRAEAQLGMVDARLALVSYNHATQQHLDLTAGTDLPDDIDAIIESLQPSGWTNIRDALDVARGLLVPDGAERAATQAVVLLTDGIHNYPDDTTALDNVGALQDTGVQVFSVGFGAGVEAIDEPTLKELGAATGGNYPLAASSASLAELFTGQIYDLLLGGLIASAAGAVGAAPPHAGDQAPSTPARKRPPLTKLLDAFRLGLDDLLSASKGAADGARDRFAVIKAYVEEGAERASFTLHFPPKQPLWLYLIAPNGAPHAMTAADTRVVSRDSTEFPVVKAPQPGLWRMVAARPEPGSAIPFHAFAGVAHRRVVVGGGAADNPPGAPVVIRAAAVWGDRLSGLRVSARVIAPNDAETTVLLNDVTAKEPDSGIHQGVFVPTFAGRHHGMIEILGRDGASPAQLLHRLNHVRVGAGKRAERIHVKTEAARFVRLIPFSFCSGERPKLHDAERPQH